MLKEFKPKSKKSRISLNKKEKLPHIYSPLSQTISNSIDLKNNSTGRSISTNFEAAYKSPTMNRSYSPNKNITKTSKKKTQQILIEFIPDKYWVNSNSKINFMAYPVMPISLSNNISNSNLT